MGRLRFIAHVLVGCLLLILHLSLAQNSMDEGPPRNWCSGTETVVLTNQSGYITDHYGGGQYLTNLVCMWIVQPIPSVDQIVFDFQKLDVEFWYDWVGIYQGASTDSDATVAFLTGLNYPSYAQVPIVVNGPTATVVFYSDELITGAGFRTYYEGVTCPNRCSGNGICRSNTCVCNPGWGTADCSVGLCANNCSAPFGTCQTVSGGLQQCFCDPGYYGGDCSELYCVNGVTQLITAPSGNFSDHRGWGDSLLNVNCSWMISSSSSSTSSSTSTRRSIFSSQVVDASTSITPFNPNQNNNNNNNDNNNDNDNYNRNNDFKRNVDENFDENQQQHTLDSRSNSNEVSVLLNCIRFDTEPDYDFLNVYDGDSTDAPLIGRYSGTYLPPPAVATSGQMYVQFTTDQGISRTGFTANFQTVTCPGGCVNGWCLASGCDCDIGWTGPNCNISYCPNNCTGQGNCTDNVCMCDSQFSGRDCSICIDPSCDIDYCSGTVTLRGSTGTFGDHTYQGSYRPNSNCQWLIIPDKSDPFDAISLQFVAFDLELDQAFVTVTDPATGLILAEYTGDAAVFGFLQPLPPQVYISSDAMSVTFTSTSSSATRTGFLATYSTYSCPDSCSGRGTCLPGSDGGLGTCLCDEGFRGISCNESYCPFACYGNGRCDDDVCVCDPGYFGPACIIRYCEGLKILTDQAGSIQDRSAGQQYRPNSNCQWLISPTPLASNTNNSGNGSSSSSGSSGASSSSSGSSGFLITLWFTEFRTEDYYDVVRVYDGNSTNGTLLLEHSGSWPPDTPVVGKSGSLFVTFTTDTATPNTVSELSGWKAQYFTSGVCATSCGLTGYCLAGECICFAGWTGPDCQSGLQPSDAQLLVLNQTIVDQVYQLQWKWYRFSVTEVPYEAILQLTTEDEEVDSVNIYARDSTFPTLELYSAADETINAVKYIALRGPATGDWFVGVEGQNLYTNYTLTLYYSCPSYCANGGYCSNYVCVCPSGWTGPTCQSPDTTGSSDSNVATIILVVVLWTIGFAVIVLILALALIYWRYQRRPDANPLFAGSSAGRPAPRTQSNQDVEMEGIDTTVGTGYSRFN